MSYSLNEVEATAKKATRGAGYAWGIAEEAGKAVRFLCASGLDGCGALARVLEGFEGQQMLERVPNRDGDVWGSLGGMCPLLFGTVISDTAQSLLDAPMKASNVRETLLLGPFAALAARGLQQVVNVRWGEGRFVTDGAHVECNGEPPKLSDVTIALGGVLKDPLPRATRVSPKDADWAILNKYAHRTYAPATEESRRKGAG